MILLFLTACTTTIECPPVEGPSRAAFVLDHGRHASLAVERADGVLVRYAYGDRRWYAENRTGTWRALVAAFTKTDAVIGRRELRARAEADSVARAAREGVETVHRFEVAPDRADALITDLDRLFRAAGEPPLYNTLYDLEFAPHPRAYTVWHNSNHEVGAWLRALDCDADGGMFSRWHTVGP